MNEVIYIAGPITGIRNYRDRFRRAEMDLEEDKFTPLNPAMLPEGMRPEQYMRICLAMVDSADALILLPGWQNSRDAVIEAKYARYCGKPIVPYIPWETPARRRLELGIALDFELAKIRAQKDK